MISELGYKKIKAIVAKNDNEITPEEAATLLILIERSGMMDKVKTAGKILREAANNKDTEFSSVHCTAKNATVKVYGFTEKKVDEESYAKDFPELYNAIMEEKRVPTFVEKPQKVGYMDGCKVYFKDGSFVSCRFSGTEPLLRFMAESDTKERADCFVKAFEDLVSGIIG